MRNLLIACVVGAVVVAVAFWLNPLFGWMVLAGSSFAGLMAAAFRCRHPHPALQPLTVDFRGRRTPAHWYCDECGRRWPAVFEHDRRPIQRFTGFDPSKAVDAARRAQELEARLREAAVERAGHRESRPPLTPVSIDGHRIARAR